MIMMKPINIDEWEITLIDEKKIDKKNCKTKHHGFFI
jgi:hypothetical protein